jgi:homocysteine S-methyltransferase
MTPTSPQVRILDVEQWDVVRDIRLRALKTNPEAFGGNFEEESGWSEEKWRELFIKSDYLVAFVDGKSAGMLFIEVLDGDHGATCWIGGCWVDPEFRGKKVFSAIFNSLDLFAGKKGWQRQGLGVWTHNATAIAAYEALGFNLAGDPMPSTMQPGKFYMHMARDAKLPLILDGGLSTALEELGNTLNTTLWSGELLQSHSDEIRAAHKLFVDAGAQILITSSYQISYPGCLARGWSEQEVTDALLRSTELARFPGVRVAASVGPYGAYLADGSEYRGNYGKSLDELKDFHRPRLRVLLESRPDLLAVETIPELLEARAILDLFTELNSTIPFYISFSCKDATSISSGEGFADAAQLVLASPLAVGVGINCTAPALITPLMESAGGDGPFILYPNSGRTWDAVAKIWQGPTGASFEKSDIERWKSLGVILIGGCCGVGPRDIAELAPLIKG